jgi:hypothetical protein
MGVTGAETDRFAIEEFKERLAEANKIRQGREQPNGR